MTDKLVNHKLIGGGAKKLFFYNKFYINKDYRNNFILLR